MKEITSNQLEQVKQAALVTPTVEPECTQKVREILNLSDTEFTSIMAAGKGISSTPEWLKSIDDVIEAGPPFTDTLTNSFRAKLVDLVNSLKDLEKS